MAAPNLQAEGATATGVTIGVPSITIPSHATDDIIVVSLAVNAPNTPGTLADIPIPSGYTLLGARVGDETVSKWQTANFWKRATSASETVTATRGVSWDTGTDTMYNGRAYVIRGCITTGDPFDEADSSPAYIDSNQAFDAVTVSGSERMVVQFGVSTDNAAFAMTASGWTTGTEDDDAGGTDSAFQTARIDNTASTTGTTTATVAAPVQGGYSFTGVSFKPPTTNATGTGAVTIPAPAISGTGTVGASGTGAITIPAPSLSGTGAEGFTGSGGVTIPASSISGTGTHTENATGSGGVVVPAPSLSGTGAESFTGSGGVVAPAPSLSGTGAEGFTGSGGVTAPAPSIAAEGTHTANATGSGGVTIPASSISGTGTHTENATGSGGVVVPAPSLSGTGAESFTGSGGVVAPAPSLSGAGAERFTGSGGVVAPAPSLSGAGEQTLPVTGSGGVTIPGPSIAGTGSGGVVIAIATDPGGRAPFDDWTLDMDNEAILELYVLTRKTR